ncbi:hypothetical protein HXY33_05805 [Candidatus Bathyarchaeota archaeon]|nr:hypothetical protein [Candidatus Bathyarchaeota archaeon]
MASFARLILYDLVKFLYRTFGDFYKEAVEKIAKKFTKALNKNPCRLLRVEKTFKSSRLFFT